MRVSISATGSVRLIPSFPLPAGLAHARDFPLQGELTETNTAEAELPQHGAASGRSAGSGAPLRTLNFGVRLALSIQAVFAIYCNASEVSRPRNGHPSSRSSAIARSSRSVVVTNVMSIPWIFSTLS